MLLCRWICGVHDTFYPMISTSPPGTAAIVVNRPENGINRRLSRISTDTGHQVKRLRLVGLRHGSIFLHRSIVPHETNRRGAQVLPSSPALSLLPGRLHPSALIGGHLWFHHQQTLCQGEIPGLGAGPVPAGVVNFVMHRICVSSMTITCPAIKLLISFADREVLSDAAAVSGDLCQRDLIYYLFLPIRCAVWICAVRAIGRCTRLTWTDWPDRVYV